MYDKDIYKNTFVSQVSIYFHTLYNICVSSMQWLPVFENQKKLRTHELGISLDPLQWYYGSFHQWNGAFHLALQFWISAFAFVTSMNSIKNCAWLHWSLSSWFIFIKIVLPDENSTVYKLVDTAVKIIYIPFLWYHLCKGIFEDKSILLLRIMDSKNQKQHLFQLYFS